MFIGNVNRCVRIIRCERPKHLGEQCGNGACDGLAA
jgi:hypothetical protein